MLLKSEPQYTQIRLALGERISKAVAAATLPELSGYRLAELQLVMGRTALRRITPLQGTIPSPSPASFISLMRGGTGDPIPSLNRRSVRWRSKSPAR
jgi:hypothetical protein